MEIGRRALIFFFAWVAFRAFVVEAALAENTNRAQPTLQVPGQDPGFAPDRVIVKYRTGAAAAAGARLPAAAGAAVMKHLSIINADIVSVPQGWAVDETVQWYQGQPGVEYAEPDYLQFPIEGIAPATTPDDPRYGDQWALNNTGQTGGTTDADIDAPEAWDVNTGSPTFIVAVIDTGADPTHPDLASNIWVNAGEIPNNGLDDDANGFIDDVNGWDFFHDDNSVYDPGDGETHATHVSGTVAAVGNNAVGVTGVAWQARLMILKFLGPEGGLTSDAISAIQYAVANGARLTTNSWGGGGFSQALQDAIEASGAAGMLFIAAAGNDGVDTDISPSYPSSYPLDNIISVAATDHNDGLAGFSNFGLTSVDLAAPGVNILSTWPTGTLYNSISGTSMATPHVAGVAVLVHSAFPGLTHLQVRDRILQTGDPLAVLDGKTVTGRRLNAFNALEDDQIPPNAVADLAVVPDVLGVVGPLARTSLSLEWTAPGDDGAVGTASSYDLRYATAPIDDVTFITALQATGLPAPAPSGTLEAFTVVGLAPSTQYFFALKASDNLGNVSDLSNTTSGTTSAVSVIFADDAEAVESEDLWTADVPWARTTEDASPDGAEAPLGGVFSWTDSPGGDYGNNVTTSLTSIPFSLANRTNSALQFDHRYDLENAFDFGRVEVSTNAGLLWTTLSTYTGIQNTWTGAAFDLSAFDGEPSVQVRFRLVTDVSITRDGWYVDDVRVVADPHAQLALSASLIEAGKTALVTLDLTNDSEIAGIDYQIQWVDAGGLLTHVGANLTGRTLGFTHTVVVDGVADLLTAVLVDPGGTTIAAETGAVVEHRMAVTLPVAGTAVTNVGVEGPVDPREGLSRMFFEVPFNLLGVVLSDVTGNPVGVTTQDGNLEIDILNADVNFSGDVDVADIVSTIDFFLDRVTFTELQFMVADTYVDEVINVVDLVRGINIILGRNIGTGAASAPILAAGQNRGQQAPGRNLDVTLRPSVPDGSVDALVADIPLGVVGLQLSIQYDPSQVRVSGARLLLADDRFEMVQYVGPRSASFMIYSPANIPLPAGTQPVIALELESGTDGELPGSSFQLTEILGVDAAGVPVYPSVDPMLAVQELLGIPSLTSSQKLQLDRRGNRDGVYNLGDLLALFDRSGLLPGDLGFGASRTPPREPSG